VGFAWTAISKESEMSRRFLATLAASALAPGFVCAASARPHSVNATDSNFMIRATADGIAEVQMAQKLTGESSMNDATGQ
jgi:hypothetical protein